MAALLTLALIGSAAAESRAQDGVQPAGPPTPACPCEVCEAQHNYSSWAFYRLSDVYARTLSTYDACFWPRSLACDYSKRRSKLADLDAFMGAVRRRLVRVHEAPPAADEVVWHLRLGDTVDCDDAFERPCARAAKYVLQRPYFAAVAALLPPNVVVTLVYATSHAACKGAVLHPPARSRAYVAAAAAFLRARGFEVRERVDNDPDADMTYLCRARTLVLAGGGYTRLAGECARAFDAARPATVFGLAAPATDVVKLTRADRERRDAALAADKARRAAKKRRPTMGG